MQTTQQWHDLEDAIKILGRGYSRSSIYRKISTGELVEGVHYVVVNARLYKFNIDQIQEDWIG